MPENERSKNFKIIRGRVVSDKMKKTRVILVESMKKHPVFKKIIRESTRIKIHDEMEVSSLGDLVSAIETRPLSKEKRHRLFKVLEKST